MATHGPWEVSVLYENIPRTDDEEELRQWTFVIKPRGFRVYLKALSPSSSFTYTGYGFPNTNSQNRGDGFQIHGSGSVSKDEKTGGEIFEGTFEIVGGSGDKSFEGVSGGGKLKLECNREGFGMGTCVFEGMCEVGAFLM